MEYIFLGGSVDDHDPRSAFILVDGRVFLCLSVDLTICRLTIVPIVISFT